MILSVLCFRPAEPSCSANWDSTECRYIAVIGRASDRSAWVPGRNQFELRRASAYEQSMQHFRSGIAAIPAQGIRASDEGAQSGTARALFHQLEAVHGHAVFSARAKHLPRCPTYCECRVQSIVLDPGPSTNGRVLDLLMGGDKCELVS
jgi:hypothetical protein